MRLVSFEGLGGPRVGVVEGDRVYDVSPVGSMTDVLAELSADPDALAGWRSQPSVVLADVELLPPVTDPGKILCIGLNYADHCAETGQPLPTYPVLFVRFTTTLVGAGAALVVPAASIELDYEGELVAVIGKGGRNIAEADALDHVIAYSVFNDASVRNYQRKTTQFTAGKNFDATGGFGPWLVTADELPPGAAPLRITTTIDGEVYQQSHTGNLVFGVASLVALASQIMTLEPGDLIVTGTPGGVGAARSPQRWLRPGEVVSVDIEGIGTLRNPVAAGA